MRSDNTSGSFLPVDVEAEVDNAGSAVATQTAHRALHCSKDPEVLLKVAVVAVLALISPQPVKVEHVVVHVVCGVGILRLEETEPRVDGQLTSHSVAV